jgi:hypothetical protein
MKWKMLILTLLLATVTIVLPQQGQAQTSVTSFRRNFATIIFCGVGGAVLGISTLSFYGDPQNHVGNITTGLLLGLIGGGTYVGMQASEVSKEAALDPLKEIKMRSEPVASRPLMSLSWNF